MPRQRVAVLLSAFLLAASALIAACSGFTSANTNSPPDAANEGDAGGGVLEAAADTNTRFCDTSGDHFVCADFDKNDVTFGFEPSYSTLDGAAVALTEAGAVSKPFAAGFSATGYTFTSIMLDKKLPMPAPTRVLVRGHLAVHASPGPGNPALALVVTCTRAGGEPLYLSVQIDEKPTAPSLLTCKLTRSQQGGGGESVNCEGGDPLKGVAQPFTLDLTSSLATFSLESAGGGTVVAKRDLSSFNISEMNTVSFGIQSSFSSGKTDAGTWNISFDNLTVDLLP